jgi:hypothetical protein
VAQKIIRDSTYSGSSGSYISERLLLPRPWYSLSSNATAGSCFLSTLCLLLFLQQCHYQQNRNDGNYRSSYGAQSSTSCRATINPRRHNIRDIVRGIARDKARGIVCDMARGIARDKARGIVCDMVRRSVCHTHKTRARNTITFSVNRRPDRHTARSRGCDPAFRKICHLGRRVRSHRPRTLCISICSVNGAVELAENVPSKILSVSGFCSSAS